MADQKENIGDVLGMAPVKPQASGSSRVNIGSTERLISAAGGALLTTIGARRGSWLTATLGGYLMYRGASGFCPINSVIGRNTAEEKEGDKSFEISKSVTINKPRSEVYQYWRKLENLPNFMYHLESVTQIDSKRSHWVAKIADNALAKAVGEIEWDAEIIEEAENDRLLWRSVPGASWDNAGEVRFVDAPGGRGTEVHTTIRYTPPAGDIGQVVAKVLNSSFKAMVKEDIRRFKRIMETGEIANNEGPRGGDSETINPALRQFKSTQYSSKPTHESSVL